MYIVESINEKPLNFFYGIFKNKSKAGAHLRKLKKKTKKLKFRLVKAKIKRYPIFITAKDGKIRYYRKKNLLKKLDEVIRKKEYKKWEKNYQFLTIYKIEKNYAGKESTKVGLLPYRVDKKFIERFKKQGEKVLKTK